MRRNMLCFVAVVLLAAGRAAAEDNEAEKLFRGMEEKVHAAKTLRVRFDLTVTGADGKKGKLKGALTLGEGDKYRAEGEGAVFGEAVQFVEVCDGATVVSRDRKAPKADKPEKPPKDVGAYLRGALPRVGFFLATLNQDRPDGPTPDLFLASDFRLGDEENVGTHKTQIVYYTVKEKGADAGLAVKVWIDSDTHLPARLKVGGGQSDWTNLAETYGVFAVDDQLDGKSFELPK